MNKNIIFIVIVAVVAALAIAIIWQQAQKPVSPAGVSVVAPAHAPEEPARPVLDTTTAIQSDLDAMNVDDLDTEFSNIDKDLQSL